MWPQAKEHQKDSHHKLGERCGKDSPRGPSGVADPVHTSSPEKCERIHPCCFKSPGMAAPGHLHTSTPLWGSVFLSLK